MKKLLLKISALFIIVTVISNAIFFFIKLPYSWAIYYNKEKCVEENARMYNVLLLGSSRVYRQIDPVIFDSLNAGKLSTTTINLGMDAMTMPEVYYQFGHLMKQKNLHAKYILVDLCDVDTFDEVNLHTDRKKYYYTYDTYRNSVTSLMQSTYPAYRKFLGVTYHSINFIECMLRVNQLNSIMQFRRTELHVNYNCDDLFYPYPSLDTIKGQEAIKHTKPLTPHTHFLKYSYRLKQVTENISALLNSNPSGTGPLNMSYLNMANNMIAEGKKHSVQVIFILSPKLELIHYRNVLPVFYALNPENRIDMANPVSYPEFYLSQYTYDWQHLNGIGAKLYTARLSEQFLKTATVK